MNYKEKIKKITSIVFFIKLKKLIAKNCNEKIHLECLNTNINEYSLKFSNCYTNRMANSTNLFYKDENTNYFIKILNHKNAFREISGYLHIINNYPVSTLKKVIIIYDYTIIYFLNYDSITYKKGLLADVLRNENFLEYKKILNIYKQNMIYNSKFAYATNNIFFIGRIKRLKQWYLNSDYKYLKYKICINGVVQKQNLFENISLLLKKLNHKRLYYCFLSQGDPTDLNIGSAPVFLDFGCSGYNSFVGEFAILFWNIFRGRYFAYKYHKNSYLYHEAYYEDIDNSIKNMNFSIDNAEKIININYHEVLSTPNKIFLEQLIYLYNSNSKKIISEINAYLKYFLAMRVISIFNLNNMELVDQIYSIYYFFTFIEKKELSIKNLKEILNDINEV